MKTEFFDFKLPRELIAQEPSSPRDAARLLHIAREFDDLIIRDLPKLFSPGDVLVLNNTQVIPARLRGLRNRASIEITLHKINNDESWCAFAKPARKLHEGDIIKFSSDFWATVIEKREAGEIVVNFAGQKFFEGLTNNGLMPLPPYIDRKKGTKKSDNQNYQTVYAKNPGAVAAPTAGLHFTEELLQSIKSAGVEVIELTLHVGAGTFLPVKVTNILDHKMHSEWGKLDEPSAERIIEARRAGGRITACGTTVLRLLESASKANGELKAFEGDTNIFITPGYKFQVVDRQITNFHLPRSTLFMLVSAFSGLEKMQSAYRHAVQNSYRFYSYGDACLLERGEYQ